MTDKQRLFITEYLKDLNATQAAIRAGYAQDSAAAEGSRLLRNVNISSEISAYLERLMAENKSAIKAKIIDELKQLAFNDLEVDLYTNSEGNAVGVRRTDRLKALELLGKYAALFTENIKINGHIAHSDVPLNQEEAEAYKQSIEGLYGAVDNPDAESN